jgi:hypothetical protein
MPAASALLPMLNYGLTVGRPLPCSFIHRVHTERQLPLYGVHFIMMENSALACEGGGARPPPITSIITITYKVAVYVPAEREDILPVFHLYPLCTLLFHSSMCIYVVPNGYDAINLIILCPNL